MKNGFSLVELSIVLVILGLLTGGILGGQALIRAAELRSVSADFSRYQTAVMTFRDKYFAFPGDMANATAFWGTDSSGCPNGGGSIGTCNGDGDTTIDEATNESFRFWQHLALGGLIEGAYSGIAGAGSPYHTIPRLNSPATRISNAGIFIRALPSQSGNTQWYDGNYPNHLMYGGVTTSTVPSIPIFSPSEAWNIDVKADDGLPGQGRLMVFSTNGWNNAGGTLARCTLSTSSADRGAGYALGQDSSQCTFIYFVGI